MPQPTDKSRVLAQANPYFVNPSGYPNSSSTALSSAIAALPSGGLLELGPGDIYINQPLLIDKPITFRGTGRSTSGNQAGTRILFQGHTAIIARARVMFEDFALCHSENTNTGLPTNSLPPSLPNRQWRPNRQVRVGTHINFVRCPWRKGEIDAGRPWHFGISFRCSKANGSTVVGTAGNTGATEPSWPYGNPKIGEGDLFACTFNDGTDVVTATGHPYSNGQRVQLATTGALPSGLAVTTTYFVRDVSGATFKLAATAGGAAVDFGAGASGTHTVFRQAFSTDPIVDGDVEWTPVLAHGVEVQSVCHFSNVHFQFMPGNAINVNASTLYAQVTSTIDPRLGNDWCNASLGSIAKCAFVNIGGTAIFLHGFDASIWYTANNDFREIHGYGIYDHSSFGGIHVANHADGPEEGYYWGRTGCWLGNYVEATYPTFGCPVMKQSARWYGGIVDKFSGIADPAPTTITRGMAAVEGQAYKLSVDNGYHYLCVESGTTHATIEPSYHTGVSWYLSPVEQGIAFEDDTYPVVTDGTAKFRAWSSSEVSNGEILGTSLDQLFTNRYDRGRFWAGGRSSTPRSAYSFSAGADVDNAGTVYDMVWDDTAKHWCHQRGGSTVTYRIGGHGSTNGLPVAGFGLPGGVYLGGGAASFAPVVMVDSVPANGAFVTGALAIHRDATSGQPAMWQQNGDGTWTALFNKP